VAFFEVGLNNISVSINLFRWIDSESLNVLWGFHFDSLTVSMLIPVLIVSSLVHIYSIGYMSHDPRGSVTGKRFYGDKLSNSGDILKLKVPSYSWKTISGWSNYSGMVTSLKMSENSMDNRGSKSGFVLWFCACFGLAKTNNTYYVWSKQWKPKSVKEQRVDGSWSQKRGTYLDRKKDISYPFYKPYLRGLRCTLRGFERNEYIKPGFNLQKGWNSHVKIPSKQFG
jgi:hypothetical protein